MSMRSLLVLLIVFGSLPYIVRSPYIGILMWEWIAFMNPHRLTFGFTVWFPFAALVAGATFIGLVFSREPRRMPWSPLVTVWLVFWSWTALTTLQAYNASGAWYELARFSKINIMIVVTMLLLTSRRRIEGAVAVVVASLIFYGVKGGLFTLRGGGEGVVWGPRNSFIAGNNELAFALVVILPLAWYSYLQYAKKYRWVRWGLPPAAALTILSILGSQSRGALLAVGAMLFALWLRSRNKLMTSGLIAVAAFGVLAFMPQSWSDRMRTIETYELDNSALGRLNAWQTAFNLANHEPIAGGGFNTFTVPVFAWYAPDPTNVRDVHSIYFEVLGEHGYVGLLLFLTMGVLVMVTASRTIGRVRDRPELAWAADLARLSQVSFVGYAVGGTFLGLAYFDLPYTLMAFVVCTHAIVQREVVSAQQDVAQPARNLARA